MDECMVQRMIILVVDYSVDYFDDWAINWD